MIHRLAAANPGSDRTWRPPLVVQRSAVDCGLAALESVIRGHRLPVPPLAELARLARTDAGGTHPLNEAAALQACGLRATYEVEPFTGFALRDLLLGKPIIADVQGMSWTRTARPWQPSPSEATTIPGHRARLLERAALPDAIQTTTAPPGDKGHAVILWRLHRSPAGVDVDVLCPSQGRRVVPAGKVIRHLRVSDAPDLPECWVAGTVRAIGAISDDLEIDRRTVDVAIDQAGGWRGMAHILACLEHVWRERELGHIKSPGAARRAVAQLLALEPGTPPVDPSTWHASAANERGLIRTRALRYVVIHGRQ